MAGPELIERVQRLTAELERVEDPHARRLAEELAAAVLELHGEGLERMLEALDDEARGRLADDALVGSLLLIHGLHPVPLEQRVQEGLDRVRPYMESHGGNVELLGIEDGIALLRLTGSCDGCAASASTLELAVERELQEAAPDLLGMAVEGAVEQEVTGVPLPMAIGGADAAEPHAPSSLADWVPLDGAGELEPGQLRGAEVAGERLVVANVDGTLLAYRDACVACGAALDEGELTEGVLVCPGCSRRFYLPRAGRSLDEERLQLEPVPLLADRESGAKVALPA
jgi:Fe-S cluster biogenesis protein NfuA/nitrite reductase/ring-hydroxylating ferredoxin subunit